MLTTVRAYSSWQSVDTLLLDDGGRPETDLIQIRNAEGLGPVTASVNTSPMGSIDGDSYTGSTVSSRNIVLTLRPNPNWSTWTFEKLRKLLYTYFMPKRLVRLVFESEEISPVEIFGYVESNEPALFSKDGEIQVSVICPYPYFVAVTPRVFTGVTSSGELTSIEIDGTAAPDTSVVSMNIDYEGSIETGVNVEVSYSSGSSPTSIGIQVGDPSLTYFRVAAGVDATKYFSMNSVPAQKYAQNVALASGVITNLLPKIQEGSNWPLLLPGQNSFAIATDQGIQDWKLTYFERYGGL